MLSKTMLSFLLLVFFSACKEKFHPEVDKNTKNLLVVDGFIETGGGQTSFRLTQTVDMVGPITYREVPNATLKIEGEDGTAITAITNSAGVAEFATKLNNQTQRYKLSIVTQEGKTYATNFLENKKAPEITSIVPKIKEAGLQLEVNTEDNTNKTKYYGWTFEEVFEFESKLTSSLAKYAGKDSLMKVCWGNNFSKQILLASSTRLSADRISNFPLTFIDRNSKKISKVYSINLGQYALTEEGYNYLLNMKKNTEKIGSIFDPQPSETPGNIRCVSNPSEPVLGFVSCGAKSTKRIFVHSSELPLGWGNYISCNPLVDTIEIWRGGRTKPHEELWMDFSERLNGNDTITVMVPTDCLDCSKTGINKRPTFWPKK
jgi:hypothetical protein